MHNKTTRRLVYSKWGAGDEIHAFREKELIKNVTQNQH